MAKDKVMLIKQNYTQARDSDLGNINVPVGGMTLVGMVSGISQIDLTSPGSVSPEAAVSEVKSQMIEQAERLGATRVYGVEYVFDHMGRNPQTVFIYGDAYCPSPEGLPGLDSQ